MRQLDLLIPPVPVLIIFASLMGCVALFFPSMTSGLESIVTLAVLMGLAGALLILVSSVSLIRYKTTLNPMRPELTAVMVKTGVYQYSRNPIYLGLLIILTGWAIYLNNILSMLLVPAFVHYMNRFQIEPEEKALHHRYGTEFEEYRSLVRRWL